MPTGEIKELTRKVSETQTLKVVRGDAGFAAKMIDNPVETRIRTATATIDSSLFQAAEAADISDIVALKLANVFAWDIDFVLDIREGDRFTAVYEQIYQDGKYLRDGEVLAAEFVNDGKVYRAVRFVAEDGSASYYTPDGQPMRKAFLRAPVEFTRVSSVFNPHRLHPDLEPDPRTHGHRLCRADRHPGARGRRRTRQLRGAARRLRQRRGAGPQQQRFDSVWSHVAIRREHLASAPTCSRARSSATWA